MNLSEIVSSELKRKYHLKESVERIMNETDEEKRFHHVVDYLDEIMSRDGFNEEMLEGELDEGLVDWFKSLFGSSAGKDGGVNASDIASKGGSGILSQLKEWGLMQLLGILGFQGPLAEALATAMSEMSFSDMVAIFKGRESCKRHGGSVADALSEAIVTYILQSTKGNSMAYNFIKNTLFEYVKQSNFGESAANLICNAAYGAKQKISGQQQPVMTKINKQTPALG